MAGLDKTNRLLEYQRETVAMLRSRGIRGTAIQITEDLTGYPILNPAWVRDAYDISYQSASSALQTLEKVGIVRQHRFRNNRVFYLADQVLEI